MAAATITCRWLRMGLSLSSPLKSPFQMATSVCWNENGTGVLDMVSKTVPWTGSCLRSVRMGIDMARSPACST